jgi:hypothetical protein
MLSAKEDKKKQKNETEKLRKYRLEWFEKQVFFLKHLTQNEELIKFFREWKENINYFCV